MSKESGWDRQSHRLSTAEVSDTAAEESRSGSRVGGSASPFTASISVSVVMATYNGARFLEPQLASIAAQTLLPTELVVCDDQSTDESVEIVERFAARALFDVYVVRNPVRLGFAENFLQAARLSHGDLIAWCDQDDVWMADKLARCAREFERDAEVMLVVHSRRIGDWVRHGWPAVRAAGGEWVGPLNQAHLGRRTVHTPASLPVENSYPGYASVISRRTLEIADGLAALLPGIVGQFTGHDTWTSFIAGAVGKVVLLPDVLVQYRQHTDQVTGGAARPQSVAGRTRASIARPHHAVEEALQARATRALFRASVLTQLAAHLDAEAGFTNSPAAFRASLKTQLVSGHVNPGELARSAAQRGAMWHRHGQVQQRRLDLWRQRPASPGAAARLLGNIVNGDYGRRSRGGLGLRSLGRDIWFLADISATTSSLSPGRAP